MFMLALSFNVEETQQVQMENVIYEQGKDKNYKNKTCLFCQLYLLGLHEQIQEEEVFNSMVQNIQIMCEKQPYYDKQTCFRNAVNDLTEYRNKDITIDDVRKSCERLFLCETEDCDKHHHHEKEEEEYEEQTII